MSLQSVSRVLLLALAASACSPLASSEPPVPAKGAPPAPVAAEGYGNLPLSFIENRGQLANDEVAHYVQTPAAGIGFTASGVRVGLSDIGGTSQRWGLAMDFVGGRAAPIAEDPQEGVVSYFRGRPEDWKTGMPTHGRVRYRDLWPGIDLVYRADGSKLKYDLVVHPGADPDDIRLRWRGATDVSLERDGSLRVSTPAGSLTDAAPVSFQGERRVATAFRLDGSTAGFQIGRYDRSKVLVIDPVVMLYAGYLGGDSTDEGKDIAVDASGAAYVTGSTESAMDFPTAVGPDLSQAGGQDAFVAKINPQGNALLYAGFIGGVANDYGEAIAVDGAGAAYVSGGTSSEESSFPATVGPDVAYNHGPRDGFVAKIDPSGTLAYAGYLGGTGNDLARGIAVDTSGAAYVAGSTSSSSVLYPSLGPPFTHGGSVDAFVAKVAPGGALSYWGWLGGSEFDDGFGIAVDGAGAAYIVGQTESDHTTFPETVGPDHVKGNGAHAFVAKVAPGGAGLAYAGYIGGDGGSDEGRAIAVDAAGAAYVAGGTLSPAGFPSTLGPPFTYKSDNEAFFAKVVPGGSSLAYAGFLGGAGSDTAYGIAVDASETMYMTGTTSSDPPSFPATAGPFLTRAGGKDAFVAKIQPGAAGLAYAGYVGGAMDEEGWGIAVDALGAAYVAGNTQSPPASFPETVGPFLTYEGNTDAFMAKLTDNLCLGALVTIQGTTAAETLTGTAGDDVIVGLAGNDVIDGAGGNDVICGGEGNDTLLGGAGDDKLDGETGVDTASFPGPTGVTANLTVGTATGLGSDTLAGFENLAGSSGNDTLTGDASSNVVTGGAGNDSVFGEGGNDELLAGEGNDAVSGGAGNDRILSEAGDDSALGGDGDDLILGGEGDDTAFGGDGDDELQGEAGKDRLRGEAGNDLAVGGTKADRLSGGGGRDRLRGQGGKDRLSGGGANDRLAGGKGNDRMNGGKGKKDRCNGGKGKKDTASKCEKVSGVP